MAGVILNRIGLVAIFVALSIGATFQHFLHLLDIVATEPYVNLSNRDSVPLATVILGMLVSVGILTAVENRQRSLISRLIAESRSLRTLTEFSATIVAINDDSRLLNEAADQIRDQFGYYYVQVFMVEPQSGLIVRQALNQVGHVLRSQQRIPQTDPTNSVALAVRTGNVQQIALGDPPERRTEFLPATQSEALIPLAARGRVYGVLDVHSIQPNPQEAFELEALRAVANQLTLAIQNIQRGQALETVDNERRRLQEQTARLGHDLERYIELQTSRDWGQYLSNRPDNLIGYDWVDGRAKESTALSDSLLKTYRNAMPQVTTSGAEQVLSVPIVSRGQALGVLEFRVPQDRPWDGRSIELARTVAQRLALSLENIRLFEQAQIVANREATVNQIAARLEAKVSLESLIEEAQQSFAEATGSIKTMVQFIAPQVEAQ
jgi:GAF domain-containing protein